MGPREKKMTSFKELLNEGQKTFSYRLKTVVNIDDEKLSDMERLLKRYKLLDVGSVHKIAAKDDSLEFRDIENADVYFIDFMIGVPMSAYILQQELRAVLNLPEKFLVVRADNEAIEVESMKNQLLRALNQKAREEGYTQKGSLLSTDRFYLDAEQPLTDSAYGDEYNSKFLNLLHKIASNRKTQTFQTTSDLNPVEEMQTIVQQPQQDKTDFNAHLPGVKPVYKNVDMGEPVELNLLGPDGNFDDDTKRYFQVSRNAQGQKKVISMDSKPIRRDRGNTKAK
jgi:hypothetical protein